MAQMNARTIKAFEKFNNDVEAFKTLTEEAVATLYEDAFTTRNVSDFKLSKTGKLTWIEDGAKESEQMVNDDEAKEYLSFWRACLRRAKRYWEMDAEKIDAIHEGEADDINDEE